MAKLLLEFASSPDEVRDAGLPLAGTVSLVISKAKGMRCSRISVQLQCRELSQARSSGSRSGQLGRMGASVMFRGISAALKCAFPLCTDMRRSFLILTARRLTREVTEFCVSKDLYQSDSMEVLTGTVQHPFELMPARGSPGSLPLPGRHCSVTTGCERVQYVLVASAVLKGRMRKYKVSCEQELALAQRPPLAAIREYREYYCTEQSTGTSQSNDKTFWFFSGQVKCTASLNRHRFFLSESDPLVLSLEVCNNSTATMRGMSASLAMEVFTDSSEERLELEPSRLASCATVPLEFAIPVGESMANACVLPAESKGFTWPLPLVDIDKLYPTFRGDLVNVQYRLVVKLLFKGVNIPLKMILPVIMLEPPRYLSLDKGNTEVPPSEPHEAQEEEKGREIVGPAVDQEEIAEDVQCELDEEATEVLPEACPEPPTSQERVDDSCSASELQ